MNKESSAGIGIDPTPFLANTPGIIALFCVFLLGFNVWKLYALIKEGDPQRLRAAQTLLFASMAFSFSIFLIAVGALIVLDGRKREVALSINPRNLDFAQLGTNAPTVRIAGVDIERKKLRYIINHPVEFGQRVDVDVDFDPYINWRIQQAREFAVAAQRPGAEVVDPGVN